MNFMGLTTKFTKYLITAGVLLPLVLTPLLIEAEEKSEPEKSMNKAVLATPKQALESIELRNDRALAEHLGDSDAKWLMAGKTEFLGIFNADSSGIALGSILLLPAPGHSPLAPGALPQLADELSTAGWHSLAITLPRFDFSPPSPSFPQPIMAKSAGEKPQPTTPIEGESPAPATTVEKPLLTVPSAEEWHTKQHTRNMEKLLQRLLTAEAELLARGGKYVLLAQGTSAELVLELIFEKVILPSGLIILNIDHPIEQQKSRILRNLMKIKIPVLNVYNLAQSLFSITTPPKLKGENYQQLYIPGTDNNFRGSEVLLVKRIKGWLKKTYSKAG